MPGNRESELTAALSPGAAFTFTIYYPTWLVALCWLGGVLLVPATLQFIFLGFVALLSHAWIMGSLVLLWALAIGYPLARSAPALLTMLLRAEVTVEGVHIRRGKGAPRFVPWNKFGEVREYPLAEVRRYFDLDGNEIFSIFYSATNAWALDDCLRARRVSTHES